MDYGLRPEAGAGVGGGPPGGDQALTLLRIAWKLTATLVLLGGAWVAVRMAVADGYARLGSAEGLEKAVTWEPGNADYHRWLGIALLPRDSSRSEREFREAIRLNPWDADSRMRLATLYESQGRTADAEKELVQAAEVDATFLPRWALANFEFRRNRMDGFWKWARASVPMSYGDRTALFDLAAATGETQLAERLGLAKDDVWASYFWWALAKAPASEVRVAARHVIGGKLADPGMVVAGCNRLLDVGDIDGALEVWNAGVQRGVIAAGTASRGKVTNTRLRLSAGAGGFDWVAEKPAGGFLAPGTEQGGVRIHFNGEQSERSSVLVQRIAVAPGASYMVKSKFRTMDMSRNSGLRWMVSSGKGPLAAMEGSLWSEDGGMAELKFRVPDGVEVVRLELVYQRPAGEVRLEGTILVDSVEMNDR